LVVRVGEQPPTSKPLFATIFLGSQPQIYTNQTCPTNGAMDVTSVVRPGAHVIRGALMHLMYQLDQGVCCPITMTFVTWK